MHLIILYGPPASGKLTVAKVLAKKSGYPLLHNHLVADFASALFPYGTDEYVQLATNLRFMAIDAALAENLPGLIMTFAYGLETKGGKRDDAILKSITSRVKRQGGSVLFVRLTCADATLLKRVGNTDRKKFHKLSKPALLKRLLREYPLGRSIPFADSLTIDTTHISPEKAARIISA